MINKDYYSLRSLIEDKFDDTVNSIIDIVEKIYKQNNAYIQVNANIKEDFVKCRSSNKRFKYFTYDIKSAMIHKDYISDACSRQIKAKLYQANCSIVKIAQQYGLVLLGQTNSDEFCCGSYGTTGKYAPALLDDGTSPGGSSSGGAISARYASHVSVATDTGGSCRWPALINNIIGFKTTFGAISRYLVFDYANSLDTISFMSRNIEHIEIAMQVWAYKCFKDSCAVAGQYTVFNENNSSIIISVFNYASMSVEQRKFINNVSKVFNIQITNIEINFKTVQAVYNVISAIEFFSSTNKFEEVKHTHKFKTHKLNNTNYQARYKNFSDNSLNKLFYGSLILGHSKYRPLYRIAVKQRSTIVYTINSYFTSKNHIIIMPALIKDNTYIEANLLLANLSGCPAISFNINNNIYDSISIIAPMHSDNVLIHVYRQLFSKIH